MNIISRFKSNLNTLCSWSNLSRLGRRRDVKSFGVFLILIPIVANSLSLFPSEIVINGLSCKPEMKLSQTFSLNLALPFRWAIFYACSIVFTIANIIYAIWCPSLIKDYLSFSVFKQEGGSFESLKAYLHQLESNDLKELFRNFSSDNNPGATLVSDGREAAINGANILPEKLNSVFAFTVRKIANNSKIARHLCFSFYTAGFILILLLLIQNTITVINILPK